MKDQIKKAWGASYRYRLWLLAVLLGVNTLVVLDVLMTAVKGDRYFVAHEDEVIYYGSAKVFAETGSVQAESCITEDVSPVGQINWYGPGYSVVYGMLRLLFGDGLSVTIWVHFALALLAVFATLLISEEVIVDTSLPNTNRAIASKLVISSSLASNNASISILISLTSS